MRVAVSLLLLAALGCAPGTDGLVAHGDAGTRLGDAVAPLGDAAHVIASDAARLTDAVVAHDAYLTQHADASVARADAYACPTYDAQVAPIYVRHCGSCHTTGGVPHFGTSYTVASQSSSACGTSMAQCTIDLGQPGGSMASRDALHGFDASELSTLRSWIACGRPR